MKSKLFFGLIALGITSTSLAQTQNAILGQPSQIRFAIPNVTNQDKCHIEVILPNQQKIAIDVDGPQFNAEVNFTPDQIGSTTLKWDGKRKNRGLNSVNACPGSGVIQISVRGNTEFIAQQWSQYFSKVSEPIAECVKTGMGLSQVYFESSDPTAKLTLPTDQVMRPIYEKCDSFTRAKQPQQNFACTLSGGIRTFCDNVYTERRQDGQLTRISRIDAIKLHFSGRDWALGNIETADAKINRTRLEEETKNRQAAEAAAKLKLDEEQKAKQIAEAAAKKRQEEAKPKASPAQEANRPSNPPKQETAKAEPLPKQEPAKAEPPVKQEPAKPKPTAKSTTDL
jgi:hypothetical protein